MIEIKSKVTSVNKKGVTARFTLHGFDKEAETLEFTKFLVEKLKEYEDRKLTSKGQSKLPESLADIPLDLEPMGTYPV